MVVKAGEHDGDILVQSLAAGNAFEIFGLDVAAQSRVGATTVRDAFRVEFLLHAALAKHVDLVLGPFELEDAGNVDGGAVGGAEDFLLRWMSTADIPVASRGKCLNIPQTQ